MRARRIRLPEGVALVQYVLPRARRCLVSSELDALHARLARDAADMMMSRGYSIVILTVEDLERALTKARARPTSAAFPLKRAASR